MPILPLAPCVSAIGCLHAHGASCARTNTGWRAAGASAARRRSWSCPRASRARLRLFWPPWCPPLSWLYGRPDLFDTYSCGVLLMQMSGAWLLLTLNP